jgi:hypothetical protein
VLRRSAAALAAERGGVNAASVLADPQLPTPTHQAHPAVLKRKRPMHVLGTGAAELFWWIQQHGMLTEQNQ